MKLKINFLVAFLLLGANNYAQQRTCAVVEHMKERMKNPEYKAAYEARQGKFQQVYEHLLTNPNARKLQTVYIPVAVHYPYGDEDDRTCLVELAQDQIRILNEDFSATNEDISDWDEASPQYPGVEVGSIDVQFALATENHPTGIDSDLIEGEPAVTIGEDINDSDRRFAGYQNFLVKNLGNGTLGYSPLGGQPSRGDSVVQTNTAFGSGDGCPGFRPSVSFNLGRTVTHELGHHYNLNHSWGSGCGRDDGVNDTPNISGPSYGCKEPGSVVMCNNKSLTTNYMDYVNDRCMFMFTEGQARRMDAYIITIKDDWKDNVLSNESFEANKVFSIYPNPANNEINVSLVSNVVKDASYELFDIIGKSITKGGLDLDTNIQSRKINTSNLTNGVYLLKINSGKLSITNKIIVKH